MGREEERKGEKDQLVAFRIPLTRGQTGNLGIALTRNQTRGLLVSAMTPSRLSHTWLNLGSYLIDLVDQG